MPNLALWVALGLSLAATVIARPQEPAEPILLTDQPASLLRFSPDGTILAAADRATIRLFDTRTNTIQGTLQAHLGSVTSLSLSADGVYSRSCAPSVCPSRKRKRRRRSARR